MSEVPSLINLCIGAIKDAILEENGNLPFVYKLPAELFDQLLPNLPPLALQNLQEAIPSVSSTDQGFVDDSLKPSRKRKRFDNFDIAWKALYESRWSDVQKFTLDSLPEDVEQNESTTNWQQIYWERHLQNCLDAVAEMVSITLFDGFLGEVEISDALLKSITYERHLSMPKSYLKLEYHCERFGLYARCLRLRNVHCVAEIGHLLRKSRLEYLETHWIKSKEQVAGLCKLLEQNNDTLSTVEFLNCKLPASLVTAICDSLCVQIGNKKGSSSTMVKTNWNEDKSSNLWLSFSKKMKIRLMISARAILVKDDWIWKSLPETRFEVVAEFLDQQRFEVFFRIKSELLSPITYSGLLIYKLPKDSPLHDNLIKMQSTNPFKCSQFSLARPPHTPVIQSMVDQNYESLSHPRKIKGYPKLRKDGWMELSLFEVTTDATKTIKKSLMFTAPNNMRGLVIQGIEFRSL